MIDLTEEQRGSPNGVCPLLAATDPDNCGCIGNACEWWVSDKYRQDCAIPFIAKLLLRTSVDT